MSVFWTEVKKPTGVGGRFSQVIEKNELPFLLQIKRTASHTHDDGILEEKIEAYFFETKTNWLLTVSLYRLEKTRQPRIFMAKIYSFLSTFRNYYPEMWSKMGKI